MNHIKLFEEMNIEGEEFPKHGNSLSMRERKVITDLVDEDYLDDFDILVDDHYYYCQHLGYYNIFNEFKFLKDYVLYRYYMIHHETEKVLELLKVSKLDPSFDNNYPIYWSSSHGYINIVKYLLNDTRSGS